MLLPRLAWFALKSPSIIVLFDLDLPEASMKRPSLGQATLVWRYVHVEEKVLNFNLLRLDGAVNFQFSLNKRYLVL